MPLLTIDRLLTSSQGTPGHARFHNQTHTHDFATIEPPWKNNLRSISCIPAGTYQAAIDFSHSPPRWNLPDVPKRSQIQIHAGNWAGDAGRGLLSDSQGCILIGDHLTHLRNQLAVSASRTALRKLYQLVAPLASLTIQIRWVSGTPIAIDPDLYKSIHNSEDPS
jgi:hypothetical protein